MKTIHIQKFISAGLLLLFFATTVGEAYAFNGYGRGWGRKYSKEQYQQRGRIMDEIMDELDLTTEQREKIKAFREAERTRGEELREQMRTKRGALHRELEKYEYDQSKVNTLVADLTAIHKDMLQQRINGIVSMKSILTQEQFETLQEKIKFKREVRKEARRIFRQGGGRRGKNKHGSNSACPTCNPTEVGQ